MKPVSSSSASSSVTLEEDSSKYQSLLLAIDTAQRGLTEPLKETLKELRQRGSQDHGDPAVYLKQAVLIAFRRRNHAKSQAEGVGSGEKSCLFTVLMTLIAMGHADIVESVLHLVPLYGCYRDLRMIAVECLRPDDEGLESGTSSSEAAVLKAPSSICERICDLFAAQLLADTEKIATDSKALPSSAAKFVPTHFRSRGKSAGQKRKAKKLYKKKAGKWVRHTDGETAKKAKTRDDAGEGEEDSSSSEDDDEDADEPTPAASAAAVAGASESAAKKRGSSFEHKANCLLATMIAKKLFPEISGLTEKTIALEAKYRRFRSNLTQRLSERGAMLESILCSQHWDQIDFAHTPKGALLKNAAAIKKSAEGRRWQEAMRKNIKAVPDINDVIACAELVMQEITSAKFDEAMSNLQIKKGIQSAKKELKELAKKVIALLKTASTASTEETSSSSNSSTAVSCMPGGAITSLTDQFIQSMCPVGAVVDTSGCESSAARHALVLSAYLSARAQGLSAYVVDGRLVRMPTEELRAAIAEEAVVCDTDRPEELEWVDEVPAESAPSTGMLERIRVGCKLLFDEFAGVAADTIRSCIPRQAQEQAISATGSSQMDAVVFCVQFDTKQHGEAVDALITELQRAANPTSETKMESDGSLLAPTLSLRTLRIHQLSKLSGIQFRPRPKPSLTSRNAEDIDVDVCFIVDFTGSMGPYIEAVKQHLVDLINNLSTTTRVRSVRIGLVGYRDYQDEGRVVTVPFHRQRECDAVIDAIRAQRANGGGDAPEDLLSGIVAASELTWQSHVRIAVIITDAEAHGYAGGQGDYHKSGLCPDQLPPHPTLPQALHRLANELNVDTLYCQIGGQATNTQQFCASLYPVGGFGCIPLQHGATGFYEQILAGVQVAVLDTLTPPNVSGIQSASGVTLSAVVSSLTASVRESTAGLTKPDAERKPLSDWERLRRDLELDELAPVRFALGLMTPDRLSVRSGLVLLQSGITVDTLRQQGCPEGLLAKIIEATKLKASRL
jgi:hypothetical protein